MKRFLTGCLVALILVGGLPVAVLAANPQAITFDPIAPATYGDTLIGITASTDSLQPVQFTSADTTVCTVTDGTTSGAGVTDGTVTIVAAGTCTIHADAAAANGYDAASTVTRSFPIAPRPITVTANADSRAYDATTDSSVLPTITSGSLAYTDKGSWSQSFDTPFVGTSKTLTPAGTITEGAADVTTSYDITFALDNSGEITTRSITVSANVDTKPYDGTTASLALPTVTGGTLASGDDGTWSQVFDTPSVGIGKTLTPSGTVAHGPTDVTDQYSITFHPIATGAITALTQTISFGALTGKTFGDDPFEIGASTNSGGPVVFSSLDTTVCTVATGSTASNTTSGTVTIHHPGTCTIDANAGALGEYAAATHVSQPFAVEPAPASCSVTAYDGTYDATPHGASGSCTGLAGVDLSANLNLTGTTHTGAGNYSTDAWSFHDPNGDYADQGGTVADVIGQAAASFTVSGWTGPYDGAPHSASGSATGIGGADLSAGLSLGTTFTGVPGGTAHWTFHDPAGNYADASGDVAVVIAKAGQTVGFTSTAPSAATVGGPPYTPAATSTSGGDVAIKVDTSSAAVCSMDGLGVVSFLAAGTCTLDGDQAGDGNWDAAPQKQQAFAVAATGSASQHITFDLSWVLTTYGDAPFAVSATTDAGPLPFTYSSLAPSVCSVNAAGSSVDVFATGDCSLRAWQAGDATFAPAHADASFTVAQAAASVSVLGWSGPYDGSPHGASGSATGVAGADLSTHLNLGAVYTGVPGGVAHWSFHDPAGNYADASGDVAVTIFNDPVAGRNDVATVTAVLPSVLDVLANDSPGLRDAGQPMWLTAVTQGSLGRATTDGHSVTYDPNGCSTGSDLFSYTVTDGLTSATAYVAVTISRPATPVTNPPGVSFIGGSVMSSTVPMRLSWCGVTATSARTYRIAQSTNGGATYPTTIISSTSATSSSRSLSVGTRYAWLARTTDSAHRTGPWAASASARLWRFQDTQLTYRGTWHATTSSSYSGRTERYATSRSASASVVLPSSARAFAVVASKSPTRGSFRVYVDNVWVATVSERSSRAGFRIVLTAKGLVSGVSHTIKIVPYGNGRIDIDAILALG